MLKHTYILGIKVTQNDKKDIISYITDYLQKKQTTPPLVIFTPNPEMIVQARTVPTFTDVLNSSAINLPDGQGLLWASRRLYPTLPEKQISKRIAGVEFMDDVVRVAAQERFSIGLIGGRRGVALQALNKLKQHNSTLTGWAIDGPEVTVSQTGTLTFTQNDASAFYKNIIERISTSNTRVLFVALGAPKQELFIEKLKHAAQAQHYDQPLVVMSVGGAFDIISGKISRAPTLFSNYEFIWRLMVEPWRFIRQLRLFTFIYLTLKARLVLQ